MKIALLSILSLFSLSGHAVTNEAFLSFRGAYFLKNCFYMGERGYVNIATDEHGKNVVIDLYAATDATHISFVTESQQISNKKFGRGSPVKDIRIEAQLVNQTLTNKMTYLLADGSVKTSSIATLEATRQGLLYTLKEENQQSTCEFIRR